MNKVIVLALAGLLAIAPTASIAAKKKGARQEMQGEIALAAPYPADGTCFTGATRRTALASDGAVNGVVGYHFDLDPRTAGKNFQLHVTGGSADVDLDIAFYADFGSMDDPATAPANVAFETREAGGEEGKVPAGMTKVIVCMYAGSDAAFHYMAGKGVK
ncbi:MAG: hypothetical protein ACRDLB_10320 [Actinomycetota bacterium]